MKKLFLLLLLLPLLCHAQKDPCRKIKKEVTAMGISYKSPDLRYATVVKEYRSGVLFGLYLRVTDHADHFERWGAIIEFDDGTKVQDESTQVYCQQEMTSVNGSAAGGLSHSGEYHLQGFFHITDANIKKFTTRKIVNISLDNAVQHIHPNDATRLRLYIRCMNDMGRE